MGEVCIENEDRIKISDRENKSKIEIRNGFSPSDLNHSVLLILNQKIDIGLSFRKLWDSHSIRVCADGGANRLYNYFTSDAERAQYLPNYIIGDLDSLHENVYHFYDNHGVIIIKQTTQYSTDFKKCIYLISLHFNLSTFQDTLDITKGNYGIELDLGIQTMYNDMMKKIPSRIALKKIDLLVLGGIGGRFDQTIHSITQLYTLHKADPYFTVYYLTRTDLIFLIPSGGIFVDYDPKFRDECIGNCGLLPIGDASNIIETEGLKWDVQNWPTSIDTGRVSSSNRFAGIDKCYINVDRPIVINIEIFLDNIIKYI